MDSPEILATQGTQDEEMCQFPTFASFYFSSNYNAILVFILLMSYWWAIKKNWSIYFGKVSNRGPNSEGVVSSAFGSMWTYFLSTINNFYWSPRRCFFATRKRIGRRSSPFFRQWKIFGRASVSSFPRGTLDERVMWFKIETEYLVLFNSIKQILMKQIGRYIIIQILFDRYTLTFLIWKWLKECSKNLLPSIHPANSGGSP